MKSVCNRANGYIKMIETNIFDCFFIQIPQVVGISEKKTNHGV